MEDYKLDIIDEAIDLLRRIESQGFEYLPTGHLTEEQEGKFQDIVDQLGDVDDETRARMLWVFMNENGHITSQTLNDKQDDQVTLQAFVEIMRDPSTWEVLDNDRQEACNSVLHIYQAIADQIDDESSDLWATYYHLIGQTLNQVGTPQPQAEPKQVKPSKVERDELKRHFVGSFVFGNGGFESLCDMIDDKLRTMPHPVKWLCAVALICHKSNTIKNKPDNFAPWCNTMLACCGASPAKYKPTQLDEYIAKHPGEFKNIKSLFQ